MNLFEYEGKQFLRQYAIPVPESVLLTSDDQIAPLLYPFVLKAQVMTGGRGKAGGVKLCGSEDEYLFHARNILHMQIKGHNVHGLLAEQAVQASKEYYIAITLQGVSRPTLIFSRMGGMDIESVAASSPEEIYRVEIDPFTRLKGYQKRQLAQWMDLPATEVGEFLDKLQSAFFDGYALLVEINPLGIVDGKLMAMDAKVVLDDHAKDARPLIDKLTVERDKLHAYEKPEKEATTVTYVPLSGDVGMISDGAGTGMLTLDLLTESGLDVACFTELGGMTSEEVMYRAMELTVGGHPELKALIIVLIGGFNRMDNMARGITRYKAKHKVNIPVFTRMCGTMEDEGIAIMKAAGLETYYDLTETVEKVRAAVKGE